MRNIERDVRDTIESMLAPLAPRASVTFKDLDHGRTRAVIAVGAKQKAIIFRGTAPKGVTSALKRIEIDTRQALRELGAIDCPRASGIPAVPGMPKPNIEHHRLVKSVFGPPAAQSNTHNPSLPAPVQAPLLDRTIAAEITDLRTENADLRARIEKLEAFARQFE